MNLLITYVLYDARIIDYNACNYIRAMYVYRY